MLTLRRMTHYDQDSVNLLTVNTQQQSFVSPIREILAHVTEHVHPHVICVNSELVGFFLIDCHYPAQYDFASTNSLGLRSFFIAAQYQGKGYGKFATQALPNYLAQHYPQQHSVFLTVNCKNPGAKFCYASGGFHDTLTLYHGGGAGPQHIMRLDYA